MGKLLTIAVRTGQSAEDNKNTKYVKRGLCDRQ